LQLRQILAVTSIEDDDDDDNIIDNVEITKLRCLIVGSR